MKKILIATVLAAMPAPVLAVDVHGTVEVETKSAGENLEFTFKNVPNGGLVTNLEGPWKLELKSSDDLTLAKTTFTRPELDEKNASFTFVTTAKPAKPEGEIQYKFVTFVCTKDKTTCYRDVHEGKTTWKVAAK